jgi:hypothetical protein
MTAAQGGDGHGEIIPAPGSAHCPGIGEGARESHELTQDECSLLLAFADRRGAGSDHRATVTLQWAGQTSRYDC